MCSEVTVHVLHVADEGRGRGGGGGAMVGGRADDTIIPYVAGPDDYNASINRNIVPSKSLKVCFTPIVGVDQVSFHCATRSVRQISPVLHGGLARFRRDLNSKRCMKGDINCKSGAHYQERPSLTLGL